MTAEQASRRSPDWRESFVEELGLLALDSGTPRAMVRILGWLVICEPPEASAQDIQRGLQLSAGTVSSATRALTSLGYLERLAYPGDRRIYYRVRPGGWDRALQARLGTVTQLRDLAERTLAAAGQEGHSRLQEMHDVMAWFEDRIKDLLAKRGPT